MSAKSNSFSAAASSQARNVADSLPSTRAAGEQIDRRTFLQATAVPGLAACAWACLGRSAAIPLYALPAREDPRFVVEAQFYDKQPYKKIKCKLCPRECVIDDRERGYCGVRENRGGTYYTLVHSRLATAHVDPIEKKPFFHFCPGILAFSVATAGCNVNCKFCQNWDISQARPEQVRANYVAPRDLAALAQQNHCPAIAYTYSEPVVFYEYLMDAAEAAHNAGIKSVVVTGGYIQKDPLKKMCRRADAIKVDLKAFSQKYYKDIVNGELKPVLDALVTICHEGTWLEIVYLVVPTLNDSDAEFQGLARWIKSDLGADVPVHFTRFYPQYLLKNLPPTPLQTLERAKAIADAEGLHYAYIGNVPGHPGENTYCPQCRRLLIERLGFIVRKIDLHKGKCRYCQHSIAGVWQA